MGALNYPSMMISPEIYAMIADDVQNITGNRPKNFPDLPQEIRVLLLTTFNAGAYHHSIPAVKTIIADGAQVPEFKSTEIATAISEVMPGFEPSDASIKRTKFNLLELRVATLEGFILRQFPQSWQSYLKETSSNRRG